MELFLKKMASPLHGDINFSQHPFDLFLFFSYMQILVSELNKVDLLLNFKTVSLLSDYKYTIYTTYPYFVYNIGSTLSDFGSIYVWSVYNAKSI